MRGSKRCICAFRPIRLLLFLQRTTLNLFNIVNTEIEPIRSKYEDLSKDKNFINEVLEDGSKKARILAKDKIAQIREVIGITKIS